jgi:hypothetical protein
MRFHVGFQRYKGTVPTGKIALGADTLPSTAPNPKTMDNVLFCKFDNINGWPCHRVAVVCNQKSGTATSVALAGQMFIFETRTQAWHAVDASATAIPMNQVVFFDVVALLTRPPMLSSQVEGLDGAVETGSIEAMLLITDPNTTEDGEYDFAIGADLTTAP